MAISVTVNLNHTGLLTKEFHVLCLCLLQNKAPTAKTTSAAADATVPSNKSTSTEDSVEPATEKLTDSVDDPVKTNNNTDDAKMVNPPSLVDLATQCVSTGTEKRRAWADSPMEPAAVHPSSGTCYELDPTPQEAAAAAAAVAAASHKPTSSDSGGEDSAKENKESSADRSDNGKGTKKKGL